MVSGPSSLFGAQQLLRRVDEETKRRRALRAAREVDEVPGNGGRKELEHAEKRWERVTAAIAAVLQGA